MKWFNAFAFEFLRSLKSLQAKTKRRIRLAMDISQVFDNCVLLYKFNLWTYGWESVCDRGPDCQDKEFANRTLGVMLNKFAFEL